MQTTIIVSVPRSLLKAEKRPPFEWIAQEQYGIFDCAFHCFTATMNCRVPIHWSGEKRDSISASVVIKKYWANFSDLFVCFILRSSALIRERYGSRQKLKIYVLFRSTVNPCARNQRRSVAGKRGR